MKNSYKPELMELSRLLHEARTSTKMSQEKLALEAGLDRSYISRLERGIANPSYLTLRKIAKALDMPLAEILIL
jgi:transcriptional regulator with XRE-family HTH domain